MIQVITNSKSRISAFLGIIQNYTKYLISAFVIFVIDCFFNNQKSEIEWKLVIIWDLPRPLKFVFSRLSSVIFRDFPLSRFSSFEILTFEILTFEILLIRDFDFRDFAHSKFGFRDFIHSRFWLSRFFFRDFDFQNFFLRDYATYHILYLLINVHWW